MKHGIALSLSLGILLISSPAWAQGGGAKELEERVAALEQEIQRMRSVGGLESIKGTAPAPVAEVAGDVPGLSGTYDLNSSFVPCPPGSFVAAIQAFKAPGNVVHELRYWCRHL